MIERSARRIAAHGVVGLLAAIAAALLGVMSTPTIAAAANPFVRVSLPAGVGVVFGLACPSSNTCFAVGSTGSQGTGEGVVLTTRNSGASWTETRVAGANNLAGVACFSDHQCIAVGAATGTQPQAVVARTADGRLWSLGATPAGAAPLFSVGCTRNTGCLAVGSQNGLQGILASTDAGATWQPRTAPPVAGGSATLSAVSCPSGPRCFVAGSGVFETADLGVTWTDQSPPQPACRPGSLLCDTDYSLLDAIQFTDGDHGWSGGGVQCGGVGVTNCPSALYGTTDGGAHWSKWSAQQKVEFPFIDDVACTGGTCTAVAQTFSSSVVLSTSDLSHWSPVLKLSRTFLFAVTCTPAGVCIAGGSAADGGIILVSASTHPSPALGLAVLDPRAVSSDPRLVFKNGLAALLVALLIVFPSNLFNSTLAENYSEVTGWAAPLRQVLRPLGRLSQQAPAWVRVGAFVGAGALIAGNLDPGFGLNGESLALFLGLLLALAFGALVSGRLAAFWVRWRHGIGHRVRVYPAGLLAAGLGVVVSRAVHFVPGYLYGVLSGPELGVDLELEQEGPALTFAFAGTFAISLLAWVAWIPVKDIARGWLPVEVLKVALPAVFLAGIEGMVFGLVPLRYQPGEKLRRWNWGVWVAVLVVSLFTLFHVVLQPNTTSSPTPLLVVLGLFLAFGAVSVAFWGYFRFRRPRRISHGQGQEHPHPDHPRGPRRPRG